MKVLLLADETIDVDLSKLASALNERTQHVMFEIGTTKIDIAGPISRPDSFTALPGALRKEAVGSLRTFIFTNVPYENNFFFETYGNVVIVSSYGWDYLTKLPLSNGIVYFIADVLALLVDRSWRHKEVTGCIYDFLWEKSGVDLGMRSAYICQYCLTRLGTREMSNKKSLLMEDLRILLDDLSLASKWNSDILEQLLSHKSGDSDNESTGDSSTPLDFIPDENPGNYIDVSRDSIKAVCLSYLKLMEVDLEAKRKGKVFEEFTRQFFRLIKGWKVIDENANLGDCEIDLIYDITAGPPLLRQRLGDNLYVECKNRSDKSDSRDISQFVLNLMSRKVKSGIFFSMAGITGYQPENWRANTAGYKRIVDACRIHGVIVLPVVREDIELVRNGRNLVTYLEELVNRFVRI